MKNVLLGFILFSIMLSMIYSQIDTILKERSIENITSNTLEISINIIDLKKGHLSKNNEYCTKTGYWDDFDIDNILKCTYMTYLDVKKDKDGNKYINTKNNIRIYINIVDPKRVKLKYDFNFITHSSERVQNSISKKFEDFAKMKYKIINKDFSLENKIYEITLEI